MEGFADSSFDLDIGRRVVVIIVFLLVFWYSVNLLASKIKSGQFKLPDFLTKKFPQLNHFNQLSSQLSNDLYHIEVLQRKSFNDGTELLVLDVDGRHILVSKNIHHGMNYIAELDKK